MNYHKELNQKLFDGERLRPDVLKQLRLIVKTFLDYCNVQVTPVEIDLVGSMANFTWTDQSDIDISVLVNMGENVDLLTKFFDAKKKIFKRDHDVKVMGYPIEITVTDIASPSECEGSYSLLRDDWTKKPVYREPEYDKDEANWLTKQWKQQILTHIKDKSKTPEELDTLKDQIKDARHDGLKRDGEDAEENVAYKTLRKTGYIDRLKSVQRKKLTKSLSLKEHVEVSCPGGFFVKALPTTESASLLASYFRPLIPLQKDLHATILYSRQPAVNVFLPKIDKKAVYHATSTELVYWDSDNGNIVLKLESPDMISLHQQFKEAGLVPSFPDYTPHVTLVHPCLIQDYAYWIKDFNSRLASSPLKLEFYYGGYVIME